MKFWLPLMAFGSLVTITACSTAKKAPTPATPAPTATPAPKSSAKAEETGSRLEVRCEMKGDVRKLIVAPKDAGCELHYEKFGKSNVIASSEKGSEHCDSVQKKIKQNLETAGFKCN